MFLCKIYWLSSFILSFSILATSHLGNDHISKKQTVPSNSSITAAFIFGDSTVDPGNNNYIKTIFKGDFPPYGVDFLDENPSGRFTNGRLTTDFIASYVGIKDYIPAYLDPNLSFKDFTTGVSFASAGTGYDPFTAERTNVISMATQLEYFHEYKRKLEKMVGKQRMQNIIENAAYVISCGTNDIVYAYGLVMELPFVVETVQKYLYFMLDQNKWFLQGLIDGGARKIGVVGLPPVGCLPVVITFHPLQQPRSCIESLSSISRDFNQMLQQQLKTIQDSQPHITLAYGDIYTPLQDQFDHPHKYGFEVVDKGCCGTGLVEAAFLCNPLAPICDDRSKYMFWDSIHPTEKTYNFLFQYLRSTVDYIVHA